MIVWFNKNGQVVEQLEYDCVPRIGSTAFYIFAYFEGVNLNNYGQAVIQFRRPDLQEHTYKGLGMTRILFSYDSNIEKSNYFVEANNPYQGFIFGFDSVVDEDTGETVVLLDTPGVWKATITLKSSTPGGRNVVGQISFTVGGARRIYSEDVEDIPDGALRDNVFSVIATKVDKSDDIYIRYCDDFVTEASSGTLAKAVFLKDTLVFDKATSGFYMIDAVRDNETDGSLVYATSYRNIDIDNVIGDYVVEIPALSISVSVAELYNALHVYHKEFGVIGYNGDKYFCSIKPVPNDEGNYQFVIWNYQYRWINDRAEGQMGLSVALGVSTKATYAAREDFDFVKYTANQGLNAEQQSNARANIGAGDGNYNNLINKPTKLSDFTNDGNGNASDPFPVKSYVDNLVATIKSNAFILVNTTTYPTLNDFLASTGEEGYLYLYPTDLNDLTKGYQQYIYENGAWVWIGSTDIRLDDYYTKTESDGRYLQSQTWREIKVGNTSVIASNSNTALNFDNSSTGLGDVTFTYNTVANPSRLEAHANMTDVATQTWVLAQGYVSSLGSILPVRFRQVPYTTTLNTIREWLGNPVAEAYVSFILDKPIKNNVHQPGAYLMTMVYHASGSKYDLTINVLGMKSQEHYVVMDKLGTVTLGDILDDDLGQYKKEYVDSSGALILLYDNVKIGGSQQPYNSIYLYNQDTQNYDSISGGENGGDYAFPSISTSFAVKGDLHIQGDFYCYDDATINYTVSDGNTNTDVIVTLPLASGRLATQEWCNDNHFQPLDGDLTAIAGLSSTSVGFLKKTGNNTWALDSAGGLTNLIYRGEVTNEVIASGSSTRPIEISGNTYFQVAGDIIYNNGKYLVYNGNTWQLLANVAQNYGTTTGASNDTTHKLYLIGAETQSGAVNTKSNENCYVQYNRLFSGGQKTVTMFNVSSSSNLGSTTLADVRDTIGGNTTYGNPYVGIMNVGYSDAYLVSMSFSGSATATKVEIIPIGADTTILKYFAANIASTTPLSTIMSSTYAIDLANYVKKDDFEYNSSTKVLKLKWL